MITNKEKEQLDEIERMFNSSEDKEELVAEISTKFPDLEQWYIWEILTVLSGGDDEVVDDDEITIKTKIFNFFSKFPKFL